MSLHQPLLTTVAVAEYQHNSNSEPYSIPSHESSADRIDDDGVGGVIGVTGGGEIHNPSKTTINNGGSDYTLYAQRWWVVTVFSLLAFGQSLIWITYSPITDSAKAYYDISEAQVDLLLNWGMIFYVVGAPFCILVGRNPLGLRHLVIAAAWFEFLAVSLRMLPVLFHSNTFFRNNAIYFLNIAHISNALACPPISVTVTKLSCVWMGERERRVTTAIAICMNNAGTAAGMILGPYLVSTPDDMPRLLWSHFGFGTAMLLCTLAFFPATPPTPPTPAASAMFQRQPEPFLEGIKIAFRTRSFTILILGGGIVVGVFNSWSGVLQTILTDWYSDSTIGWLSFGATVAGIIGGVVHGSIAQFDFFHRRMKLMILILIGMAFVTSLWFGLSVPNIFQTSSNDDDDGSPRTILPHSLLSITFALIGIGWSVGSGYPLAFELVAEMTYPLSESISGGIFAMIANGMGIIFLFAAPQISPEAMNMIMIGAAGFGMILLPFVHEAYVRLDAERKTKMNIQDNHDEDHHHHHHDVLIDTRVTPTSTPSAASSTHARQLSTIDYSLQKD